MRLLIILALALNLALVPSSPAQLTGKPPACIGFIGNAAYRLPAFYEFKAFVDMVPATRVIQ